MSGGSVLAIDGLSVSYKGVPAVRGLSLEVGEGEVVALIGANGAGKSSTLSAVMGLVRPIAGSIRYRGADLVGQRPDAVARSGIALVPEGRQIFADLTVAENLRLGRVARRDPEGADADTERVMDRFPIVREFADRQAGLLSGGQQQQLAIARALIADPDVLLLDEPSLGLAPGIIDEVFDTMAAIRDEGRTILLVEQRAQRTVAFADRSYVLFNGALHSVLGPSDAADTEGLKKAYFG